MRDVSAMCEIDEMPYPLCVKSRHVSCERPFSVKVSWPDQNLMILAVEESLSSGLVLGSLPSLDGVSGERVVGREGK